MFTTWEFWLFVIAVVALCQIVPGKWQNLLLLAASLAIYTYLEPRFVLLLAAMILFNYWIARRVVPSFPQRQRYFWAAIVANVGVLALFKYGLGIVSLMTPILSKLGVANEPLITNLLLPLGLSFYS
ncbi:MAG: hypothetical protein ABI970_17460, partial [Chloroflexota bacterium]